MKIRIAIADDHPMIISGIRNMLSAFRDILITSTYGSGKELMAGLAKTQPDVLLLDIHLTDTTADMIVQGIIKKYPDLKILILTNLNSTLYLHNLLRLGAHGYILKTTQPETLALAIQKVFEGEEYVDESMRDKLEQFSSRARKEACLKPALTLKEKEILQLTVDGLTIQEISEKLFIGLRTVEYYRSNIFLKLQVKNMAGLIRKALATGLVD